MLREVWDGKREDMPGTEARFEKRRSEGGGGDGGRRIGIEGVGDVASEGGIEQLWGLEVTRIISGFGFTRMDKQTIL